MLKSNFISNHCNEFTICWFTFQMMDSVAEHFRNDLVIPTIPSNFNCMSNCTFHTRWRCIKFGCDIWIKNFSDRTKKFNVRINHLDCLTEKCIAFNMCWHTNFFNNSSDGCIQYFLTYSSRCLASAWLGYWNRRLFCAGNLKYLICQVDRTQTVLA